MKCSRLGIPSLQLSRSSPTLKPNSPDRLQCVVNGQSDDVPRSQCNRSRSGYLSASSLIEGCQVILSVNDSRRDQVISTSGINYARPKLSGRRGLWDELIP